MRNVKATVFNEQTSPNSDNNSNSNENKTENEMQKWKKQLLLLLLANNKIITPSNLPYKRRYMKFV